MDTIQRNRGNELHDPVEFVSAVLNEKLVATLDAATIIEDLQQSAFPTNSFQ